MDCLAALGHRVGSGGGQFPYMGPIQDWRYYRGQALTAEEINIIATQTVLSPSDPTSENLRTCLFIDEGGDSTFRDTFGHSCAWYREQRDQFPGICSFGSARENCPVACLSRVPCVEVCTSLELISSLDTVHGSACVLNMNSELAGYAFKQKLQDLGEAHANP